MNQCVQNIVIISLVLLVEPAVGGDGPRSSDAVRQSLAKYHADAKPNEATLRVVYFHPSELLSGVQTTTSPIVPNPRGR